MGGFMKLSKIFLFLLLPLNIAFSQGENIYVEILGDTVRIWNTGIYENCGCLFRVDGIVSGNIITVTEVDTSTMWTLCTCHFNLSLTLVGLPQGHYTANLFRKYTIYFPDSTFYVGTISFDYGGSVQTFKTESYQSDCIFTSVSDNLSTLNGFKLFTNFPNPFNSKTIIRYQIPIVSYVTFKVHDILGREVLTLVDEEKSPGSYQLEFNADGLPSGIYFCTMIADYHSGKYVNHRKLVLMK